MSVMVCLIECIARFIISCDCMKQRALISDRPVNTSTSDDDSRVYTLSHQLSLLSVLFTDANADDAGCVSCLSSLCFSSSTMGCC